MPRMQNRPKGPLQSGPILATSPPHAQARVEAAGLPSGRKERWIPVPAGKIPARGVRPVYYPAQALVKPHSFEQAQDDGRSG